MKKWLSLLFAMLLVVVMSIPVAADSSYTYSTYTGETTYKPCPDPYILEGLYTSSELGVPLIAPKDLCFDAEGNAYLLDSELDLIYVLDREMKPIETIRGFVMDGEEQTFSSPLGIALTEEGDLYICDTQNGRVVVLNPDRSLKTVYTCPESNVLGDGYVFRPERIVVDKALNMYIINADEYQGIMQIDMNGEFIAFIGSDKVTYDPITLLWKQIMSEDQADQLVQFIPVEYFSISMDNEGFIYAVSAATGEEPIKRLNLSGGDVLNRYGYVDICGDIDLSEDGKEFEASLFTDITSNDDGIYFALDSVKSRIFTYNREGYLLYAFTDTDSFRAPSAIELFDDKLYVTDIYDGSIAVYTLSKFGRLVMEADGAYSRGEFETSFETWQEVLRLNANYELAYAQLGRIYLRNGEYDRAMTYFEKGNFRGSDVTKLDGYNKAFVEWRKGWAAEHFGTVLIVLAAVILLLVLLTIWKRRRRKKHETRS